MEHSIFNGRLSSVESSRPFPVPQEAETGPYPEVIFTHHLTLIS